MIAKIYIIHVPTLELRVHEQEWDDEDIRNTLEFMFTDGNYACDCNRRLFFNRAAGERDGIHPCGDKEFFVPGAELPDGTWIKLDALQ